MHEVPFAVSYTLESLSANMKVSPARLCQSGVAAYLQNTVHHVETLHAMWLPKEPVFLV